MDTAHNGNEAAATSGGASVKRGPSPLRILGLLLLVILLGGLAYALPKLLKARSNPLVQHFAANAPQLREMQDLTLSQIENQAASTTAAELLKSPFGYDGRYVVATGLVGAEETALIAQNVAVNTFNEDSKYCAYVLDEGLVVVDISGEGPQQPAEGSELKCYGKVIVAQMKDIFELPWVGPDLEQEFGTSGMSERVVFLVARGVDLVSQPQDAAADGNASSQSEVIARGI